MAEETPSEEVLRISREMGMPLPLDIVGLHPSLVIELRDALRLMAYARRRKKLKEALARARGRPMQ